MKMQYVLTPEQYFAVMSNAVSGKMALATELEHVKRSPHLSQFEAKAKANLETAVETCKMLAAIPPVWA